MNNILRLVVTKQVGERLSGSGGTPVEVELNSVWYLPVKEVQVRGKDTYWITDISSANITKSGQDILKSHVREYEDSSVSLFLTMEAVSDRYGKEDVEYRFDILSMNIRSSYPSARDLHTDRILLKELSTGED